MSRAPTLLLLIAWTVSVSALGGCGGDFERQIDDPADGDVDAADGDADADIDADADGDSDGDGDADADGDSDADADGDADGDADADGDGPCAPGAVRCSGDSLETCRDDGLGWDGEVCELGCADAPEPHCLVWYPSNVPPEVLTQGEGALDATIWPSEATLVVNTETGGISAWVESEEHIIREPGPGLDPDSGIFFQHFDQAEGAPTLGIFSVTAASVPEGVQVWVAGGNAMVLASAGDIEIGGAFNCRAYGVRGRRERYPGPGGFDTAGGPGAGATGTGSGSTTEDGGGGGAGFGGEGGASGPGDLGGEGGATYGTAELIPLWGGSGGADGADAPGEGGPGGGACQLLSATAIIVAPTGVVDGCGDRGNGAQSRGGGGGGGSGGGLLLEAPSLRIEGVIAANGGGGGSGATSQFSPGTDGEPGRAGVEPAPGGEARPDWVGTELGCNGGQGSSAIDLNGGDNVCDDDDDDGGGGGGGAGRIRLNGLEVVHEAATLSPDLSTPAATVGPLDLR